MEEVEIGNAMGDGIVREKRKGARTATCDGTTMSVLWLSWPCGVTDERRTTLFCLPLRWH